jgi:hypothetical protein
LMERLTHFRMTCTIETKKQIFVLPLDLRDEFRSLPYDRVQTNLLIIRTSESRIKLESNWDQNTIAHIYIPQGFAEEVKISKDVNQSCPLSSTLFNLGIDPLIRK